VVKEGERRSGDIPAWRELPRWAQITIVVFWLQAMVAGDAACKFERLCSQYFPAGACR
jgi:hypothetical protein